MKIRTMAAAAAALSLVAAPAVAEVSFDRASAPIESEDELAGSGGAILGVLGVGLIITGVLVATDVIGGDDEEGVSP
tara:strand:- start:360 stop:590 length:231 start_codon:yes stop_codon:yes gene_type:complete